MTNTETKISDGRAKILQSLADRATMILKFVELERAGIHADRTHQSEFEFLTYAGDEINEFMGELSENIFREERPAEYAQQKAKQEEELERWHNDPENILPF